MRSSTRSKGTDVAKKSAMAELVAAKNARARKASKEDGRRRRSAQKLFQIWHLCMIIRAICPATLQSRTAHVFMQQMTGLALLRKA